MPSSEAQTLHQQARQAGARGDYAEALPLLTRAAALAPGWPYPIYDRAYTHLLMGNFEAALADYLQALLGDPKSTPPSHGPKRSRLSDAAAAPSRIAP